MQGTLKKTLIGTTLVSLLAVSGLSLAGGPRHDGPQGPGARLEHLSEALSLTDDQRDAMADIFREQGQAMRQLHAETESKIASVLTEEQEVKLKAMREERRGQWEERRERREERRAERSGKN
ncbi:hypothetical protein A167_02274 [Alcanivorax sp. S71-1-4]|jgi:periplasmic protein CpxP/Spy|uniref:periplasmic heavy metal sensor n=1 Tax=Alcanivorax sp. S71-1-4 TaxID=1177159 RepID=UPI00135A6CC9|nr:periplasmic heavy metal sensor [Alcanivorax sp. S71-1-4]KAF0808929.1 hypothetical protein A167_02274 [Alcanivorax sp. S71-1-4]